MYIDTELELADSQAVTASAASTNIIDFTHGAPADVGVGDHLYLVVQVDTAATAGGAATVTFALQTDDNSSFSSATALWTSATIAKATLVSFFVIHALTVFLRGTTQKAEGAYRWLVALHEAIDLEVNPEAFSRITIVLSFAVILVFITISRFIS